MLELLLGPVPFSPTPLLLLGILPFGKAVNIHSSMQAQSGLCYCSLGKLCEADRGGPKLSTLTTLSGDSEATLPQVSSHAGCLRICRLSLCHSSAFLSLSHPPAVLACFSCSLRQCSDVKTWICAIGEVVYGLFFLRNPGPEGRGVNGCPRHEAIGWWLRSQLGRRRQESSRERWPEMAGESWQLLILL